MADPRLSIEERYDSSEAYLTQVRAEAEKMVAEGYLLEEDLPTIEEHASRHYEQITALAREVGAPARLTLYNGAPPAEV